MSDTQYLPAAQKKLIILYRAVIDYPHDSVQSTVKFLTPRVSEDGIEHEMPDEWKQARYWWEHDLNPEDRHKLTIEYKFAAKVR